MLLLILGGVFVGLASALDFTFRARMSHIGEKWSLLHGGAFNYGRYRRARKERGWSAWPVYVMWVCIVCGISLLIAGFFLHFGTSPKAD